MPAILKTHFSYAGSRGSRNVGYICRQGAYTNNGTQVERGKLYDQWGTELYKNDIRKVRKDIKDTDMERRIILSPQTQHMTREDISVWARETITQYQKERSIKFPYVYAIHDHNGRTHIHVLAWGNRANVRMKRAQIVRMREIATQKELELVPDLKLHTQTAKDRRGSKDFAWINDFGSILSPLKGAVARGLG